MTQILTILLISLFCWTTFFGTAQAKIISQEITTKKCGNYTIQLKENGFEEPADQVSLIYKGKKLVTLKAAGVGVQFCKDITADGVPEVMLSEYSGDTRCCYTHSLYSLFDLNKKIKAPKLILYTDSHYTQKLKTAQLDASPALEIIGSDWRFVYKYGLGFSDSAPIPVIFSYKKGRYMDFSRHYQTALRRLMYTDEPVIGGQALANYAILTQTGPADEANRYIETLAEPERSWLYNYAPDIKQALSNYGMSDWPRLTVLPKNVGYSGVGGAFSAPKKREFLAMSREGARSGFYLYQYKPQNHQITRFGPLLTTRMPPVKNPKDRTYNLNQLPFSPRFTVRRANKTDNLIIEDKRKGQEGFHAYRLQGNTLRKLENDALAVATKALYDMTYAARQVGQQYELRHQDISSAKKTRMRTKRKAALAKAAPWFKLANIVLKPKEIGKFEVSAIELTTDTPHLVTAVIPVSFGMVSGNQAIHSILNERATIQMELAKQNGKWKLLHWSFTKREGEFR